MKPELELNLYRKFPDLFSNKSDVNSCMNRGMTCGDGWYNIIHNLCKAIENHCKYYKANDKEVPEVKAEQVKEKFGTLRFYFSGGDAHIAGCINMAEIMSETTCEECGNIGKLRTKNRHWIRTLCEKCNRKKPNKS